MDLYVKNGWPRHAVEAAAVAIELERVAQTEGLRVTPEQAIEYFGSPTAVLRVLAQRQGEDPQIFAESKPDVWESSGLQGQFPTEPFPEDGIVVRDPQEHYAQAAEDKRRQLEAEMAVQDHIGSGWTQADMESAADEQAMTASMYGNATEDLY